MPKAKLELVQAQVAKLPAANAIAGTVTAEAFNIGDVFHVTVRGRSTEQLMKLAATLATISDADIKAHNEREAKKKAASEKKK